MNGFPEWTPASKRPVSDKQYNVTLSNGNVVPAYRDDSSWFKSNLGRDADVEIKDVIAWMPLPPAYKPPKFGWHPWNEKPKVSGEYLVHDGFNGTDMDAYDADRGEWKYHGNEQDNRVGHFVWSYIEPTPDTHNET